jgi:hypothetical protein
MLSSKENQEVRSQRLREAKHNNRSRIRAWTYPKITGQCVCKPAIKELGTRKIPKLRLFKPTEDFYILGETKNFKDEILHKG